MKLCILFLAALLIVFLAALLAAPARTYQREDILSIAKTAYACGKVDGLIEMSRQLVPWVSEARQKTLTDARAKAHCEEVDKLLEAK